MSAETISDAIETAALTPQSASVDGKSATDRSIADKIRAAQFAAARENTGPGLQRYQFVYRRPQ